MWHCFTDSINDAEQNLLLIITSPSADKSFLAHIKHYLQTVLFNAMEAHCILTWLEMGSSINMTCSASSIQPLTKLFMPWWAWSPDLVWGKFQGNNLCDLICTNLLPTNRSADNNIENRTKDQVLSSHWNRFDFSHLDWRELGKKRTNIKKK